MRHFEKSLFKNCDELCEHLKNCIECKFDVIDNAMYKTIISHDEIAILSIVCIDENCYICDYTLYNEAYFDIVDLANGHIHYIAKSADDVADFLLDCLYDIE